VTGTAGAPPPPGADGPPPVPAKSGRGPLFWILVAAGGLFALCCAGGVVVFLVVREKAAEFAALPESERNARMSALLEAASEEELRAATEFTRAVDEERDDDAWAMTAPAFRLVTPREKFAELTDLVGQVVGRCLSKQLRNANVKHQFGSGSTASLDFAAKFEKGDGTIHFDLAQIDGTWKVASWRVDSPLFLDAMKRGSGK
jgi:uncharacterized protein DUF4019